VCYRKRLDALVRGVLDFTPQARYPPYTRIRAKELHFEGSSTSRRSDIAALKRRVHEVVRQLQQVSRGGQPSHQSASQRRLGRAKHSLQHQEPGRAAAPVWFGNGRTRPSHFFIGASKQSIYNPEESKARPMPSISCDLRLAEPRAPAGAREHGSAQSRLASGSSSRSQDLTRRAKVVRPLPNGEAVPLITRGR